ncbi:MAG: glycerophosphodiester phosphodiesterase [Gemmatimonadota bacterium]
MKPFRFDARAGSPIVVAHRGAPDRALENSRASFALAVADGADMIEFDVRLSGDGAPVVVHDARTGRTAKENVPVAAATAARLRGVRLKNGEPLPFLPEILDLVGGRVPVNIEAKAPGAMAAAARALRDAGYPGEVLLSSALRDECLAACALLPDIPCGLVTRRPSASDVAFCRRRGLPSIHPDHRALSVLRTRRVKEAGLRLLPYTVNDAARFLRLVDSGADGVFSDRAAALRAAWRESRLGG